MNTRFSARLASFHLPTIPRWLDIGFWLVVTLLCARLVNLPQARALGVADAIAAPAGQWLVLDGLPQGSAINLTAPLAGSAGFSAPRAALDPASRAYLKGVAVPVSAEAGAVNWSASGTDGGKASLVAILSPLTPGARLALAVAGAGKGLSLRVDRGGVAVTLRLETASDATARGIIDAPGGGGQHVYAPWRPLTFVLNADSSAALTMASLGPADIWLQNDAVNEGALPVTSLDTGADRATLTRTCGGPAGALMFWSVLLQPRVTPIPARGHCEPGYLAVDAIALGADGITARPSGSAYRSGELPLVSTLKSNDALKAIILAILAYPGARLMGLVKVGKKPSAATGAEA